VGVLLERGLDDAGNGMTHRLELPEHGQDTVLHLLQRVGHAVGPADHDAARRLVDRGLVPVDTEHLDRQHQVRDHLREGRGAQVEVAGVVPAAAVEAGDVLAGLEGRVAGRALRVPSVAVVDRYGARRQVRGVVPDPITFAHRVVHLHRQVGVERGLPRRGGRRPPRWKGS
jgi:hypothetical protein